ncbi:MULTISPECIES: NAD(P)H-binding protein [unclassified Rhodococcus (in: high G+C Gram-positive bacteria)]|uniref:NAD(P)H-binding protein n=1 Tax=unclassified Rhodococcus (in: high G+C Gram-positive bacteria) TaxID=192944 RepID=UPI0020CF9360|nr:MULTISPECIES: NAD(P)H-binding protein [unclassified Rhodococcus (in: high G+C Gram-positive bacteria)]
MPITHRTRKIVGSEPMKNVVIIGANGRSAREIISRLAQQEDVALTLFLRRHHRLDGVATETMTLVEGDAHDRDSLRAALTDQDIVIVALGGEDLDITTAAVVDAAEEVGVRRIVTINAGGIYDELPEPFNTWDYQRAGATRPRNRQSADVVEQSSLEYTILRPVWLTDEAVTDVELTRKGETYKGTETSRASLGKFIADLVADPNSYIGENLGITQPGTDGDTPTAYR